MRHIGYMVQAPQFETNCLSVGNVVDMLVAFTSQDIFWYLF